MNSKNYLFIFLSFFLFTSCDDALECAFGVNPEINEDTIATGVLDQDYFAIITAEVDNAANDNAYDYYFNVVGDLPEGIELFFYYRRIEIFGIPQETGTFNFRVFLSVERFNPDTGLYDRDPTCDNEVSKMFTLQVFE